MGEVSELIKVWATVIVSLCYCYTIRSIVSKGWKRFFLVVPVICLFLYLPLRLTSIHGGGITAFFVAWLANFKLLLLAFDLGPLCSDPPLPFSLFLTVACFPVRIPSATEKLDPATKWPRLMVLKIALELLILRSFHRINLLPVQLVKIIYTAHMYILLEIILAVTTNLTISVMKLELESPFKEPYLATSLQDFWGRRWNLMVSRILRPVVYEPIMGVATKYVRRSLATGVAVIATFAVSGLMHELIFYYYGRSRPTWELSCFFVLHGVCVAAEVTVKRWAGGRLKIHPVVSGAMTIGFAIVTSNWLFIPHFSKWNIDVRAFDEYDVVLEWFRHKILPLFSKF